MFKTILIPFVLPFLLSIFIMVKDRYILKRDIKNVFHRKYQKDFLPLKNLILAFFLTYAIMLVLYFTMLVFKIWDSQDYIFIVTRIFGYVIAGIVFYSIIYTNNIYKYRRILFILFAVGFSIDFLGDLYETRHHFYFIPMEKVIESEIPQCQIGMMQNLLPVFIYNTLISPGKLVYNGLGISYVVATITVIWLAATLAIGRGWCSWACMWGGWDDVFSSLGKKPLIKKCSTKLKFLPFAILFAVLISSLLFMTPTYCFWLCPFKSISETPEIISTVIAIQTALCLILFLGLAVILPLLTKKRTLCAYLCPFGAFQSIADKINLFTVKIDKGKCIKCKKCIAACPIMAIDEINLEKGKTGFTCMKCGRCIDVCPQNAIFFHIKGISLNTKIGKVMSYLSRYIFVFVAFIFLGTIGVGEVIDGLYRILLFITTGSFVQL